MKGMRRRRTDHRDSEVGREKIDDGGSYADSTGFSRRMSACEWVLQPQLGDNCCTQRLQVVESREPTFW